MPRKRAKPRCIVIAGPNGAGKTTFARDYLPAIAGLIHFVNVDLIAGGISPLRPELAVVTAGRLVLREIDRLARTKRTSLSRVHSAVCGMRNEFKIGRRRVTRSKSPICVSLLLSWR